MIINLSHFYVNNDDQLVLKIENHIVMAYLEVDCLFFVMVSEPTFISIHSRSSTFGLLP